MTAIRQASRGRRRGFVFPLRVTEEEHRALVALHRDRQGPRALGPWILWRALGGEPGDRAIPRRRADAYLELAATHAEPGVLPELGVLPPPANRTILDLCGGSGAWARPYELAGYDVVRVTLPLGDVRTFVPPRHVWGVLAAPPCTEFSSARNGHRLPRDFVAGMACVNACFRIVLQCRPRWWALENPAGGHLSRFLGTPRDTWEPCDFGDPWTKATSIWGDFALPKRGPFVAPLGGGPLCIACDPTRRRTTWCSNSAHRAVTPAGFARAFFEANP